MKSITTLSVFYFIIFLFCTTLNSWSQAHHWKDPIFVNVNLEEDARFSMQIDEQGNSYLISLFDAQITILDTTLYSTKDNGVFLAKFDTEDNLVWSKVIADSKESTPNLTRVINDLHVEIEDNFVYPVIEYQDSILLNNQLFTVEQSQTYYQDIAILKMSLQGQIEDMYHIKGSCETGYGGMKIDNGFIYIHFQNIRNNLDSDPTCSCTVNADSTLYATTNQAVLGKINLDNHEVDWLKAYNAGGSNLGIHIQNQPI